MARQERPTLDVARLAILFLFAATGAIAKEPASAAVEPLSWIQWLFNGQAKGLRSSDAGSASEILEKTMDSTMDKAMDVVTDAQKKTAPAADPFAPLRALLDGWEFTKNYAVAVGNTQYGNVFTYEGGNFKMNKMIPTGSTSKWPSAMMFAGLVDDGTISSLDDPVYKYLRWWTQDQSDARSRVTFRMLLSFTSGFGDGHPGEEGNTRAARQWRAERNLTKARTRTAEDHLRMVASEAEALKCNTTTGNIMQCARSIYNHVQLIGEPGKVYSYNSNHLQLAAAVSMAASGLSIQQVIHKYLLKPFGMTESFYMGSCPDFGGSLITTGSDYEKFLQGLLGYKTLSKTLIDASEEDYTPFMSGFYSLYGDYGFGHFLMCFDSVYGFTKECKAEKSHIDPGAFGFIPIIDRKRGYYMEVVSAEVGADSYPLSGIPEYLAVAIKPHIDAIFEGWTPSAAEQSSHNPYFLSLSVADVNYCLNCKLNPKSCS